LLFDGGNPAGSVELQPTRRVGVRAESDLAASFAMLVAPDARRAG